MEFVQGVIGTGKTTYAVNRLKDWLLSGVPPHQITVLLPQRRLALPYYELLVRLDLPNMLDVQLVTYAGLAQRALALYWSLVADEIVPNWDGREPTFLTIETAQYYMAQVLEPFYREGRFDAIRLDRARLVTQILSNLSAAAVNNFTLEEVGDRLAKSWQGHSSRLGVYQSAAEVAQIFRDECRQHALLDFSLQISAFTDYLLPNPIYQPQVQERCRYLLVDNAHENYPVVFDFINWLWQSVDDGLVVYDPDGGYRVFLAASPALAHDLKEDCEIVTSLDQSYVQTAPLLALSGALEHLFIPDAPLPSYDASPLDAFTVNFSTFYPQMLDWVVEKTIDLVRSGVEPSEIVILAPFLNDSLRFSILTQLEAANIPFFSHRPSRSLIEEPVIKACLAMLKWVYADANIPPSQTEITQMLVQFMSGLDVIRAGLLARAIHSVTENNWRSFDDLPKDYRKRISYQLGEKVETLRGWFLEMQGQTADIMPDHLVRLLFDLVSQVGYGFHNNLQAGYLVAQLIDSLAHFRQVIQFSEVLSPSEIVRRYIQSMDEGILAAQTYRIYQENAVLIAPAYTYLMWNQVADYQFWVDVGSSAWSERIEQPVTHPYVLLRDYPKGQVWSDTDEYQAEMAALRRLLLGLTRSCRKQVFLAVADLGEQGFEQRGPLLKLFNQVLGHYGRSV